jgi:hypothetical protein
MHNGDGWTRFVVTPEFGIVRREPGSKLVHAVLTCQNEGGKAGRYQCLVDHGLSRWLARDLASSPGTMKMIGGS